MSAKLLQALTDDNPDLQKQIGCMTGIFQLFDRHHVITGKRINGQTPKRISSGMSHVNSADLVGDVTAPSPKTTMVRTSLKLINSQQETNSTKNLIENQRVSAESSRASFSSSSCSSSFSSIEGNKSVQPDPPSLERATPDRSSKSQHKSKNADTEIMPASAFSQTGRESLDLRDVIKDSIYREARGLSVKTASREEPANNVPKYKDSPRPFQLSRSMDGGSYVSRNKEKSKTPLDLNESLRVLTKLKDGPWHFSDVREPSRPSYETKDGSLFSVSKDSPRFSFDSRDNCKPNTKLRELPRLSLDSRECSMRNSNLCSKSNPILKEFRSDFDESVTFPSPAQELGTQKRQPNLVAKLMGLEEMPKSSLDNQRQMDWMKASSINDQDIFYREKGSHGLFRTSKMADKSSQDRSLRLPRSFFKDHLSPRRSHDPIMKPISSSRFPVETAPWRQQGRGQSPQKTTHRSHESFTRPPTSQSVRVQIEKTLKELGFQRSDTDLRALILDAVHAKGLLDTKKEDQISLISDSKNHNTLNPIMTDQNPRTAGRHSHPPISRPGSPSIKGTSPPRTFESPIVIMKPAKFVSKSGIPASSVIPLVGLSGLRNCQTGNSMDDKKVSVNTQTVRDLTTKVNVREHGARVLKSVDKKPNCKVKETASPKQRIRLTDASPKLQPTTRESNGSLTKNSGSLSPRLQKKSDSERRSRPPIPSSDLSKSRRQHPIKQQIESGSPGGRRRPKSAHSQQSDDQLSEISSEARNSSPQGDEVSVRSDSNISFTSQVDIEVTSADRSGEMNCVFFQHGDGSPSENASNNTVSSLKEQNSLLNFTEDGLLGEFATAAPEQPSPISVLDASFYRDDLLPSPVKKMSSAFKDDETRDSDDISGEDGWKIITPDPSNVAKSDFSPEINHKLENVELLVQKLRRLNSAHDEATTDHIALLCEDANPDNRYVSEILLASGLLLKDLSSSQTPIQLHPSGHPISRDLFFVLEQTKASLLSKTAPPRGNALRSKLNKEKLHRKLIFDTVNEILAQKLSLMGTQQEPWLQVEKLMVGTPSGQRLLKEICLEIDSLQPTNNQDGSLDEDDDGLKSILREDVILRAESWTDFPKEISGAVLDIERLIFKDLVDEIVNGESFGLQSRPTRRRRQLFSK